MERPLLRILLAEDDATDRMLFNDAFKEIGFNTVVEIVNSGEQLMAHLEGNGDKLPHLLFLDLNMPQKTGLQCLKEIKGNPNYKDIFIAIYSTSATDNHVEETFMAGANVYIQKPADFDELKAVLKKTLVTTHNYQTPPFNRANFLLRL